MLTLGDMLDVMRRLPDESVDLVYLDPPFATGRRHVRGDLAFDDVWSGIEEYLEWIRPRLERCRDLLRPSGSILLHCDWRTCHDLRVMLDRIFGRDRFVNHLIWRYGLGGSSPRRFARKHDDILFYSRCKDYYFNPPRVPATSARMKGMNKKATDVLDVPAINNMAAERTGYPTQKPLALLNILVSACSPPGGFVLDPCCGSGTTIVAAAALGRSAHGIDNNPRALTIASRRLQEAATCEIADCNDRAPLRL